MTAESSLLGLLSGLVASVAAFGGIAILNSLLHRFELRLDLTPSLVAASIVTAIVIATVAGLYPASPASRMTPMDAIRMRPLENTAPESSAEVESSFIRVNDLRKSFKSGDEEIEALRGVSFEVPSGAFVFCRPVRIGKKYASVSLGGARPPQLWNDRHRRSRTHRHERGRARLFRRQKIGFVFQQFNLIPNLSAVENVLLPFIPAGLTPDCHTGRGRFSGRSAWVIGWRISRQNSLAASSSG